MRHELVRRIQMSVAPGFQPVNFPLIARQRKGHRRIQLETMLDGELPVNRFEHGVDFLNIALSLI